MKKVLVIGAGLSATYLIEYLEHHASSDGWVLTVADKNLLDVNSKCTSRDTRRVALDVNDTLQTAILIAEQDLVVSMLPAFLHLRIADICLELGIHLATASYLSDEMKELSAEAESKDLIFLNECGLDPGIDHLSAIRMIDAIKQEGGIIEGFESFTGGLVAPAFENNPWRYKFTWNPRNVVLAGSGGAVKFLHEGNYKYIPYHRVFRRTEIVDIEGYGKFEGYANRDSLKYRNVYGLQDVRTMYRGTFRRPGFSKAWNCFVQLGATDDSYILENTEDMTYREFINTFLAYHPNDSVELKLKQYLGIAQDDNDLWERLESTQIFSDKKIGLAKATPAQVLQHILEDCWSMDPMDHDMIVMWHKLTFTLQGKKHQLESRLVCEGEDSKHTAMAKTVGLPLAIACKLILQDRIPERGCILPIYPSFYHPILDELEEHGIRFRESERLIKA